MKKIHGNRVTAFRKMVYAHFEEHGRDLPWRKTKDPYHIMVSEIMLQQTQVDRVIEKYREFLHEFPTLDSLAQASQERLLRVWQGLGYNRRALFLQKAAQQIVSTLNGVVPRSDHDLVTLPGIGPATASAICAYAYNQPVTYIETNIRAVFIHHFFSDEKIVSDADLFPIVAQCLDTSDPARWYSALMDYGTDLKKRFKNPAKKSRHHVVQSKFEGSDRKIRGAIVRTLLKEGLIEESALLEKLGCDDERFEKIVLGLMREGFVEKCGSGFRIHSTTKQ